jgi:hypothetical protein
VRIDWKKVAILTIALIIFSLVVPLYFDENINLRNDKLADIDNKIDTYLHEFTRYHLWILRHIDYKSTFNILLTLNQTNDMEIPLSVFQMYSSEKDVTLLEAVKKIAILTGITGEELEQLQYLSTDELLEKKDEYVNNYAEILNGFLAEKVQLKKETSNLKLWKGVTISVGSLIQVLGIIFGARMLEKAKRK